MIVPSQLEFLARQASEADFARRPVAPLPRRRRPRNLAGDVEIRRAGRGDCGAVSQLEALESRVLPPGPTLVAELDGVLVAAISVADDTVVADPFVRTADIAALLRVRARQVRATARPRLVAPLTLLERLAR